MRLFSERVAHNKGPGGPTGLVLINEVIVHLEPPWAAKFTFSLFLKIRFKRTGKIRLLKYPLRSEFVRDLKNRGFSGNIEGVGQDSPTDVSTEFS